MGEHLWNPNYFVTTISENTEEQIRKYIEKSRRARVMIKHKAYVFRIYPNAQQEILINKTIGSPRFVFNHFLSLWNEK
ncbi:TPA: helix-turn-helix domain-containing protein [Staphylococcus pseudintermedius]|nr:helix-turn-helix domain-containing protein [Staphylococcus pseudintermedius]